MGADSQVEIVAAVDDVVEIEIDATVDEPSDEIDANVDDVAEIANDVTVDDVVKTPLEPSEDSDELEAAIERLKESKQEVLKDLAMDKAKHECLAKKAEVAKPCLLSMPFCFP